MMQSPIQANARTRAQWRNEAAKPYSNTSPSSAQRKARKHNLPSLTLTLSPTEAATHTTYIARDIQSRQIVEEVMKPHHPKRVLGQGVFGYVSAVDVIHPDSNIAPRSYAIKQNHCAQSSDDIKRETSLACTIDHPRIVKYLGAAIVKNGLGEQNITAVMELMAGTLNDTLLNIHSLTLAERLELLKDIAQGLAHLHNRGLVHNDIKLDNILINNKGRACLGDLGRALPHTGYCDYTSSKIAPEMRCFSKLQLELAKSLSVNTPFSFHSQQSLDSPSSMDTEDSGYTSDEQPLSPDVGLLPSVAQKDGKTDVYALGYIAMQLLLEKTKVSVWDHDAHGEYNTIAPELAEYRTLYANNPAALQILERLIIPCLGLERDQRPSATEVINILDGLLAQM